MGTLYVDTLEPQSGTSLTVGETGQNTVVGGNTIKLNTLKDAGGNTIFVSNGSGTLSSVNSAFGSAQVLILSQTADDSATINFTANISSTYGEYIFRIYNISPASTSQFEFQVSTDSGSNYNTTVTSTYFYAYNHFNDSPSGLSYDGDYDQAQGTAYQDLVHGTIEGATAIVSTAGEVHLYSPSSTTYVKPWYARFQNITEDTGGYSQDLFTGGYFNTTSAVNAVSFKMSTGNMESGTIKMFGVK